MKGEIGSVLLLSGYEAAATSPQTLAASIRAAE
jgi:hypothetical protein